MEHITIEECCDILDSRRIPITASERRNGRYPYYGANGIQDYVADYIFDDELVLLAEDGGNFGSKTRPIAYRVSGKCWVNNHAHVLKPMANVDVDYLCYSLMFYDTEELVNGATRQKLTQAAMRKMLIPQRPITEQKKIVSELSKIQSIISVRQQQLIVGDFNINPYDNSCVNARYFHGIPIYEDAMRESRNIAGKEFRMFYNPMWNFLGDFKEPYGTYYRSAADTFNPYWHIYDQVIIRPSLRSRFVDGNLKIITGSANVSLLDKNKHPNHSISDHLPITFEIKEDYHEQNT